MQFLKFINRIQERLDQEGPAYWKRAEQKEAERIRKRRERRERREARNNAGDGAPQA